MSEVDLGPYVELFRSIIREEKSYFNETSIGISISKCIEYPDFLQTAEKGLTYSLMNPLSTHIYGVQYYLLKFLGYYIYIRVDKRQGILSNYEIKNKSAIILPGKFDMNEISFLESLFKK